MEWGRWSEREKERERERVRHVNIKPNSDDRAGSSCWVAIFHPRMGSTEIPILGTKVKHSHTFLFTKIGNTFHNRAAAAAAQLCLGDR